MKAALPRFDGRRLLGWIGLGMASAFIAAITLGGANLFVPWQ